MMVFVNFRRLFLTLLFVMGAGTLFLGYTGVAGMFLKDHSGNQKAAGVSRQTGTAVNSAALGGGVKEYPGLAAGADLSGKESFFVEYRLQRERTRGQQIEILKEIINSPASAVDTRQAAQDQLMGIGRSVTKEARVENLLRARGYRDAVVCMDQKGVTVVVDSRGFSASEETRMLELVSRETGFGEQGITIIPKI